MKVLDAFPERTPLLGYYREGDPTVIDWQIKWAVEHGVSFFAFDWYWDRGRRQLEHALHDGYFRAPFRPYMKFFLLWANHNPPGSSSEADLVAMTDYWIAHYFRQSDYLAIGGSVAAAVELVDGLGRVRQVGHHEARVVLRIAPGMPHDLGLDDHPALARPAPRGIPRLPIPIDVRRLPGGLGLCPGLAHQPARALLQPPVALADPGKYPRAATAPSGFALTEPALIKWIPPVGSPHGIYKAFVTMVMSRAARGPGIPPQDLLASDIHAIVVAP